MSKKKKKDKKGKYYEGDRHIVKRDMATVCRNGILVFSKNVNLMRQIANIQDGLKPVERRILYGLKQLGSKPTKPGIKSGRVVGDVMGKFHPHGDAPLYGTIVKMIQPWKSSLPMLFGEGNLGNQQGDPAAAPRYTHCGISLYGWKCFFDDFNIKYVPNRPNYLGSEPEPEYLPSRYPNILLNNQFGIGIGTNVVIPSYNFSELLEAVKVLMKDPKADILLIPDLVTGADILEGGEFKEIFETGRGKFITRGHIDIDDEDHHLIIRSLPPQVSLVKVKEKILEMYKEKKIQGFVDFIDEGEENDIELHIVMKKETDLYAFRQLLYKRTELQKTIASNAIIIDDFTEYDFSIREIILEWIESRREYKSIYYNSLLIDVMERLHILETILRIIDGKNGEKSIDTIRRADDKKEIVRFLMDDFGVTSLQAKNIADMKMSSFSKSGIRQFKEEKADLEDKIPKLKKLATGKKGTIDKIIIDELEEGIKLFGYPRRSKVVSIEGEETIQNTNHTLVITAHGYIKKLPEDIESIGNLEEQDYPTSILHVNNKEELLMFDMTGKVNKVPVHSITSHTLNSHGQKLSEYCNALGQIISVMKKPSESDYKDKKKEPFLIFITRNGIIKKTSAMNFVNIKNDLLGMIVKEGDSVQDVILTEGDTEILVYTVNGMGARFNTEEIRESGRMSVGVKSIELDDNDQIIGLGVVDKKDKYLFVITDNGKAKLCTLDNFPAIQRAGKPYKIIKIENNEVKSAKTVKGNESLMVILNSGIQQLDLVNVPELPRLSSGKKLIPVKKGDNIVDVRQM